MSGIEDLEAINSIILPRRYPMIATGIDIAKSKSTVAILNPDGNIRARFLLLVRLV